MHGIQHLQEFLKKMMCFVLRSHPSHGAIPYEPHEAIFAK